MSVGADGNFLAGGEMINKTFYFGLWTAKYDIKVDDRHVDEYEATTGRPMIQNLTPGVYARVFYSNKCQVVDPERGLVTTVSKYLHTGHFRRFISIR